jgi:hypothetical protein
LKQGRKIKTMFKIRLSVLLFIMTLSGVSQIFTGGSFHPETLFSTLILASLCYAVIHNDRCCQKRAEQYRIERHWEAQAKKDPDFWRI